MYRQSAMLIVAAALAVSAGCRTCGDAPHPLTSNANGSSGNQPCRLVGSGKPISEACYDAVTGAPVPCPPQGSTMVIPGGYPLGNPPQPMQPPANELPFPSPSDATIPPQGVPFAPPSAAPGFGSTANPNVAQPTRITPIK